jgi:hypothetical protein
VENLEEGSLQDYYYSQYSNLVPDDLLPEVLNDQLQIFIADNLYQITRAGVFEVEETQIDNYSSWYNTNSTNIWETPEYIPQNEIQLDNDTYQVSEGITRTLLSVDDIIENSSTPSQPILLQPPHTGINPSAGSNIPMQLVTVGENFKGKGIIGGISNNRRFIFEAYNINYVFWSSVGIEAKLQRLRRFLWASYYGESFADELIVGADNMDLETTYFFPTPEYMAMMQMANPQFNGLVNLKLGNFIAQAWNFSFSVNTRLYSNNFTSADLSSFLNGQLNQYINGKVDPIAERIKNGFVNWADPSFQTRVRNEAMQIRNVKNQSLLRFTIINGYKTQGYSNKNNWRFDWNVMFSTSGQTAYTYNMKAGNFIGKARVGNDWYGIRIVRW